VSDCRVLGNRDFTGACPGLCLKRMMIMAKRRMFSLEIVDTDAFLEMPPTTQNLYFHLGMRADDDGFIPNPNKIMKIVGAQPDDMKVLLAKRFVIGFENGIIVIKHWKINNYIPADRYHPSLYADQRALITTKENGSYTECIQDSDKPYTQVRLGKDRIGKDRLDKGKARPSSPAEVQEYLDSLNCKYFTGQYFWDKNESTGWIVGRNRAPMKDWKSVVRTWITNQENRNLERTDKDDEWYKKNAIKINN
jgi:hypothetical protein